MDGLVKSHNYTVVSVQPCPETALDKGLRTYHFIVAKDIRHFTAPSTWCQALRGIVQFIMNGELHTLIYL